MNNEKKARIKQLAKKLNVPYGKERKGKPPGKRLKAIIRVVKDGVKSPEIQSLRERMKGAKKKTFFSRLFARNP